MAVHAALMPPRYGLKPEHTHIYSYRPGLKAEHYRDSHIVRNFLAKKENCKAIVHTGVHTGGAQRKETHTGGRGTHTRRG